MVRDVVEMWLCLRTLVLKRAIIEGANKLKNAKMSRYSAERHLLFSH